MGWSTANEVIFVALGVVFTVFLVTILLAMAGLT